MRGFMGWLARWLKRFKRCGESWRHCWHFDRVTMVPLNAHCKRYDAEERGVWKCCRCGSERIVKMR